MTRRFIASILAASGLALAAVGLAAPDTKPGEVAAPKAKPKYKHGDMTRPRPKVIEPGTASTEEKAGRPPSDAVILFNGKDLSAWKSRGKPKANNPELLPKWKVEDGYFEVLPHSGGIETKEQFGNMQLHIEWATPKVVKGNSQGRGNSGIHLGGFGEVQVLDSYQNDTYPDGQAGSLYGRFPPLVNASRKPGEWQTYDVITQLPKLDEAGKMVRPGLITVLHNGVVVHHAVHYAARISPFTISLQDHGNPVRYRDVWARKLKDYDEESTPAPPLPPKKPKQPKQPKKPTTPKPTEKK